MLARVRFESLTRKPLRLYVLADPAPGDDGNDDRSAPSEDRLIACDDSAASAVAARPALGQTSSGYRGSASDPWQQLRSTMKLTGFDAVEARQTSSRAPGRSSTARRTSG